MHIFYTSNPFIFYLPDISKVFAKATLRILLSYFFRLIASIIFSYPVLKPDTKNILSDPCNRSGYALGPALCGWVLSSPQDTQDQEAPREKNTKKNVSPVSRDFAELMSSA